MTINKLLLNDSLRRSSSCTKNTRKYKTIIKHIAIKLSGFTNIGFWALRKFWTKGKLPTKFNKLSAQTVLLCHRVIVTSDVYQRSIQSKIILHQEKAFLQKMFSYSLMSIFVVSFSNFVSILHCLSSHLATNFRTMMTPSLPLKGIVMGLIVNGWNGFGDNNGFYCISNYYNRP